MIVSNTVCPEGLTTCTPETLPLAGPAAPSGRAVRGLEVLSTDSFVEIRIPCFGLVSSLLDSGPRRRPAPARCLMSRGSAKRVVYEFWNYTLKAFFNSFKRSNPREKTLKFEKGVYSCAAICRRVRLATGGWTEDLLYLHLARVFWRPADPCRGPGVGKCVSSLTAQCLVASRRNVSCNVVSP